jgi:2-oxoglutarate dehydrogenase E2 component (dihydrolipoamide succinyltransferase)
MTTNQRPAAVARALTGAGTAIAMIGMVTGFQISAAAAEQQAQLDAAAVATTTAAPANVRGQAVRVLDASLLPEIVAAPVAASTTSSGTRSSSTAAAPAAPAAPAPAPAQPAPPANGTTAGSGG